MKERKEDYLALKTNNFAHKTSQSTIWAYLENSCKFSCTSVRWLSSVVTPGTKGQLSLSALSRCFWTYIYIIVWTSKPWTVSVAVLNSPLLRGLKEPVSMRFLSGCQQHQGLCISCLQKAEKGFNSEKHCHAMRSNYITSLKYYLILIYTCMFTTIPSWC